jgi:hypothetical protein
MKHLFFLLLITNIAFGQISPVDDITKPQFAAINETVSVAVVANPQISIGFPYVLCGGTTTLTLSAIPTNGSYTYQWLFSATENGTYSNIPSATASTFTTNPSYNVGYYKVVINDGTTPVTSPSVRVRQGATATLVSATPSSISAGQSTTLNMTFTGTGPWYYNLNSLSSNNNIRINKPNSSNSATATITLMPENLTSYNLNSIFDSNGVGCQFGNATVTVNPIPTILFGTPANTTGCAGNMIDIPLILNGSWGYINDAYLHAELTNSSGTYIINSKQYGFIGTSLKYVIPPSTPNGTYKIRAYGNYSGTASSGLSSFNINVVSTGCNSNKVIINGRTTGCDTQLDANPQVSGNTYQWYRNGVPIAGNNTPYYYISSNNQNGDYTVLISNTSFGFSGTSEVKTVNLSNVLPSILTSTQTNLCSGSSTISSNNIGAGNTYQWYKTVIGSNFSALAVPLNGETNATLNATTAGTYFLRTWDGSCQIPSNEITISLCPPIITSTNPLICGANTEATLSTSASGTVYQWSSSSSQFGTFTNISGATSAIHITSTIGFYKVTVDGNASNAFSVQGSPYAVVLNSNGNTNSINIAAGASTTLTYNLYGTAPFTFISSDGVNQRVIYSLTNQITLTHTPPSSRYFNVNSVSSAGCSANGNGQNSILVNVGTVPTISIGTVASSICAGDILSVPYTMSGTFDSNISMYASIRNVSTNFEVAYVGNISSNPLQIQIPSTLTAGTYYLSIGGSLPVFFTSPSTRTTNFTVTTACTPMAQASIQGFTNACNNINFSALPSGTGYSYQWSKDGSVVAVSSSAFYNASQSGSYVVNVTNSSTGYSSTSAPKIIAISGTIPIITSPNPSLCGANTSVTLNTTLTGAGYTYLWQKFNTSTFSYNTVVGQATQNLTLTQASEAGRYRVVVNDGTCDNISQDFTVATGTTASLVNSLGNTNAVNLNPGQTETLQLKMNGQSPFTYSFNGQSYTSNSTTVSLPVSPSVSTNYIAFSILSSGTACGTSSISTNSILVNVSPNPSFTIGAIPTTACAGGTMEIPLTLTGNWGTAGNERFNVNIYTAAGSYVSNIGYLSATPLFVTVPSNLVIGNSYKFQLSANIPYVPSSQFSSNFTFSTTCPAPPSANFTIQNSTCSFPTLMAFPNGAGYVYQWKKDGVDIVGAISQTYTPQVSGDYSVNIQNTSLSYNSTSILKAVSVNALAVPVSSPNAILCGSNTSAMLSTSIVGAGLTYQWRKAPLTGGNFTNIIGATANTLTTSEAGQYILNVNNGTCTFVSAIFYVTYGGSAILTNSMDNNSKVILNPPTTTENLKVNLTGTGPWEVGINDGIINRLHTTTISPLIVPVSPLNYTSYSITTVTSACGPGRGSGFVQVEPAPVVAFTFPTPTNLTVCKGNTLTIPYTATGSYANTIWLQAIIVDAVVNNNNFSGTDILIDPVNSSGSFDFYIPDNLNTGNYKILFGGRGVNYRYTDYIINVVNTGCTTRPAPVVYGVSNSCSSILLLASIYGTLNTNNNTYQWYKNGVVLVGKTSNFLVAAESGNYTVQVINGAYNETSMPKTVTINRIIPPISSTVSELCGATTSIALTTSFTGAGYTYQWYKDQTFSDGSVVQIPQFGQNTSLYNATSAGGYSVKVFDGSCLQNSRSGAVDATGSVLAGTSYTITICGGNPCQSIVSLASTADDYSTGTVTKEANATTGTITAINKITGTANVTYRAGKSILLDAGFKADNGVVFKTEFGGCN